LVPRDPALLLGLAAACLRHDDARAERLFAAICARHDLREAWVGLATARRLLGNPAGAAEALVAGLRRHVVDSPTAALAGVIAPEVGAPGWCGVDSDGQIRVELQSSRPHDSEGGWRRQRKGNLLRVIAPDGRELLGSPLDLAAIMATEGCVRCEHGGLTGWAWHPGDPGRDPVLTIRAARPQHQMTITASDLLVRIEGAGLLARPRGFSLPAAALCGLHGPLHILDPDGKDLLGSPLDPQAQQTAVEGAIPVARDNQAVVKRSLRRRPSVAVVVPVHGSAAQALACIHSVLPTLSRGTRLIVVDDASSDHTLAAALRGLARDGRISLLRHRRNRGFGFSANSGIRAAAGHDVVLLNSDTLVAPGWLTELRAVAYSAADTGTVTPFSNEATLLSYPDPNGGNELPDLAGVKSLDRLARAANGGQAVEIPVGVGFCLYIRRDCLDAVGLLRASLFAQGYGEENDLCLRARRLGWRHVAAPGVFVAHVGGQSFGAAARHLRARNAALLESLHPGYAALIEAQATADPLAGARRRLDLARWHAAPGHSERTVILITHAAGGGVERQISATVARHRAGGLRAIVLRPSRSPAGTSCVTVDDGTTGAFPNLRFAMPGELPDLLRLLRTERPCAIELHHLVGYDPTVLQIISALGVPYDMHVHDYAWLCARVALVGPNRGYCGEPDVAHCESCVARSGNLIEEEIGVAALRQRSAKLLAAARRVLVPSSDTGARIRRHFPGIDPVCQPHEDDTAIADPVVRITGSRCRACVIGAIGIQKGYDVLLDCARDAAERRLPLDFVVVGHTIEDRSLLETGRVFVTGEYAPEEAVDLIRAQDATLALLPSVWPETWCFGLSEAWRAGLRVVAFDIGAQAERIRRSGRGVLLPLGLPAPGVNNALLTIAGLSHHA
jgi:GT2 family glycosyltransferase/glycosyltransferase involved in cell wall biosynthesis